MAISRRGMIVGGAAGALGGLALGSTAQATDAAKDPPGAQFPAQVATDRNPGTERKMHGAYDMRDDLKPRRLTLAMWDTIHLLRHGPGGALADYDRVLDETVERGYNTLRLDAMPQWIDLRKPQRVLDFADPKLPYMPWGWNTAVKGPVGQWEIDFIEKLHRRPSLHYTLSAWWFMPDGPTFHGVPPVLRRPATMMEGAEMWATQLSEWKRRFGFDRLIYVDVANETPYFFPDFLDRMKKAGGAGFDDLPRFSPAQIGFLADEINKPLAMLRREFPELRFTTSIHDDLRWLDVPLELDCVDAHFFADADPRWTERTRFNDLIKDGLFKTDKWFAELSDRAVKTAAAVAPMLHARQRFKMEEFANWGARRGAPLTCTEGWASWYYADHPKLDWGWLLDWAKWSCDDAIACGFWGWTTHNYAQPQFENWKDVKWHRTLNERFLNS